MTLYGVSFGNGNMGVSHMFPDFYVNTDDPYKLARIALCENCNDEWRDYVRVNMDVDGEAEYTVSAVLHEGPNGETEFEAAVMICDVFPDDGPDMSDPWHKPVYDCLDAAFGPDVVATYAQETPA